MLNPMQFLQNMMQRNPNVAQNPRNQQWMQVLQSGNQTEIENLASTICKEYGVTKEQALQQVPSFQQQFGISIPGFNPPGRR